MADPRDLVIEVIVLQLVCRVCSSKWVDALLESEDETSVECPTCGCLAGEPIEGS